MVTPKCLLAVVIIASVASSAFAIHCYQCDSVQHPKCGEDFESEDVLKYDCARLLPPKFMQSLLPVRNATGCMKQTLEPVIGKPHIIRSCFFGDTSNTQTGCSTDPALPFVKVTSCEVCKENLCNSATVSGPIGIALVLFVAMARVMS